ncbi:haloalkane dehalogenase [Microbulbifer sp. THAF38]|uniref:haloalkane dehalogenase n=1 Tax=Microbulbifer sp. THAF38 TaxID=2587856 RepID=UPI001269863E|nr:haloalkane dehalogenase [Microbulbifer sp. THAF38]QFT54368.1 Haloalkane dehalogenase [Microbulbifer sp. THAF38]
MANHSLSPDIKEINSKRRWPNIIGAFMLGVLITACNSDNSEETTEEIPDSSGPNSEACKSAENTTQVTDAGVEYMVTPEACFDSLPGYEFAANYAEIDGLSMHYVDVGPVDGDVVLLLHGQPSWSYLYRKMIPILAEAGYRVIAPDNIGMGKSDKPVDVTIHQFEQHVAWTKAFIDKLQLTNINLFVHDWGSLFGLRIAGEMSHHIARLVVANGTLPIIPPGKNPHIYPSFELDESLGDAATFFASRSSDQVEGFQQWIDYASSVPELLAGDVVQVLTVYQLTDEEISAYNAPYPSIDYKAAIRAFPAMFVDIEMQNIIAWQTLGAFHNPFMFNAGEFDRGLGSEENQQKWIEHVPGSDGNDHRRFLAGHFIQEDVGEELAIHLLNFLRTTTPEEPLRAGGPSFNFRYCEILLSYQDGSSITAEIWGTPGVNYCPQAQWEALDLSDIAAEYDALSAIPNGPRFFVVDENLGGDIILPSPDDEYRLFGELEMRLLTSVDLTDSQGEDVAYVPGKVLRDNTWLFYEGRRVYELTDINGQVYIMQSFSRLEDDNLQMDDLKNLGARLNLPEGWTFRSRILNDPLQVSAMDGIAMVLKDDLGNSYQLVP